MGILSKFTIILITVVLVNTAFYYLSIHLSLGAELGAGFIGIPILFTGIILSMVVTFIKINDSLFAKIIYTFLSLLFSIFWIQLMGLFFKL